MFVKFGTEAMKVVQGTKDPGVITKAAKTNMSKSGDPNTLERDKKIGHKADPKKGAVKMAGKKPTPTPMASKKSKVTKQLKGPVGGYPKVHDPEGMF